MHDVRDSAPPKEALKAGISLCQEGEWWQGMQILSELARREERRGSMPGYFYSYLGLALARCQGRKRDGIDLCRYAVGAQPLQPENYLNLAFTYLLAHKRGPAFRAMRRGLNIDPTHPGLLGLADRLGVRRQPLLPFLSRSSLPNHLLGKLVYATGSWWRRRREEEDPDLWPPV